MLQSIIIKKPDIRSGFLLSNRILDFEESVIKDQALTQSTSNQFVETVRYFLVSSWNDLIFWPIPNQLRGVTQGYTPLFFLQIYVRHLQNGCYHWHPLTSCTQACKALQSRGHQIVLVNSNPATFIASPGTAGVNHIELWRQV